LKTIVVSGPESTGKSLISEFLASRLDCPWIPEYARDYIRRLDRPYNYSDLVHIAEMQIEQKTEMESNGAQLIILDTWLIITKVWFLEVYKKYPEWLDSEISRHKVDLFLVCKPDIPWVPDPLRENGGEKRDYLMSRYLEEIKITGSAFTLVGGIGEERYKNALDGVRRQFS